MTLTEVGAVFVPVTDQDRSLEFYVGKLGFEKVADFTYGGHHRWVEVAPPGARNTIALVPPSEGRSAGADVTRCALACGDIEAEHRTLGERGVDATSRSRARGRRGPGLSPATRSSRTRSRLSSSSATPTATAS